MIENDSDAPGGWEGFLEVDDGKTWDLLDNEVADCGCHGRTPALIVSVACLTYGVRIPGLRRG